MVAAPARGAKGAGPEFALQSSVNSSKMHDLGKPLRISSTLPVAEIDTSRIHLTMGKDSLATPVKFTLIQDTLRHPISSNIYPESSILHPKYPNHPRSFLIRCALVPDSSYTLFVEPGAFKSYWGAVNDTLLDPFKMKGLDKYGSIVLHLPDIKEAMILELLDGKKALLQSRIVTQPDTLRFPMLDPGKYGFRMIEDKNRNGKWDTGRYLKHQQPERILYFLKDLTLKANWEMEETWKLVEELE